ncbi:hypothetical protein B7C51_03065 [Paenibacillus larvae subsp. pulvifaciens]|uniref:HTH LytTR-type domain-containing protein n=1 Tax=Paenibacillus larvae subsp. pulvifaciens TaxID=1477 RepID=A0A1V0UPX4_9BACL|nr:LytTR family transcriptional regulator DNA-binding domain-containing protein [Paenibacillus larvae]ARF67002.1 hypothetical protein B7C51_03065 [Paenibacillus larvae subsp. pulvifaciens]
MKITCIKAKTKKEVFTELDIQKDVYFIDKTKKVLTFHSRQGVFYQIVTLSMLEKLLEGFGFEKFDVGNLVNVNLIKNVDINNRRVYFDDGSYTTISKRHIKKVMRNSHITKI